jgi:large repetitive protein
VEATGLAARTLRARPGDALKIALDKGGFIEGIVRDGGSGAPAPGVTVEARTDQVSNLFGGAVSWEPGAGVVRAAADAQGRFRIDGLAPGLHTVTARAHGMAAQRRGVALGKRIELYLFPGGGVAGTVSGPEGKPVAGATVLVESALPFGGRPADLTSTDARGRFEFLGMDPGAYRLVARHADFAPAWTSVTVERGSDAQADFALAAPVAITGRIVGDEAKPLAGRAAIAEADGQAPPRGIAPTLTAEAGADGRFRIAPVAPGSFVLSVSAPGYGARRVEASVGARPAVTDLGDVELETGLVIKGHVRDTTGLPIADARLMAFRDRPGEDRGEGRTDATGAFAIGGLKPGTYRLNASAPGRGVVDRDAEAGMDGLEITLDAAGSVTGLVVDEKGRPVDTFRVLARMPPPSGMGGTVRMIGPPRAESIASPDGRFVIEDVAPGAYTVEISAPERTMAVVSSVRVAAGGATDVGRVTLGAGGIVRGTVVDSAGTAVPAAVITFQGVGRGPMMGGLSEAVTDSAGAFELRGVSAGPVQLSARHPSFTEGHANTEVDPAKDPPEVRVVLLQGGRIEGRAVKRDGTPLSGGVNLSARNSPSFSPSTITPLGPDGSFVLEHVPAGTVTVMLMEGTGGQLASSKQKEVEVQEGQTSTVEFLARDILVSGRVTRGGSAAPNLRLRVSADLNTMMVMYSGPPAPPGPGPQRMTAVTREDGSFEMLVDQPGKANVRIESLEGSVISSTQRVEIPDADSFTLDLALPAATLAGIVVDRETDQPIPRAAVFAATTQAATGDRQAPSSSVMGPTGTDGRFHFEVDPGEYRLTVRAEGYGGEPLTVTASESGTSDLRLTLTRGLSIRGRIVDARGQPVGGLRVGALPAEKDSSMLGGGAQSMADGTFDVSGLTAGLYNLLSTQTELGLTAFRAGVSAGTSDVTLTLRRGGRVLISVVGPDGAPASGARAVVSRIGGAVALGTSMVATTDERGNAELPVPVGSLEVRVTKEGGLSGTAVVSVGEGAAVPVAVTLAPRKVNPPPP